MKYHCKQILLTLSLLFPLPLLATESTTELELFVDTTFNTSEEKTVEELYFESLENRVHRIDLENSGFLRLQRQRFGGIVLTSAGSIAFLYGVPFIVYGISNLSSDDEDDHAGGFMSFAYGTCAAGLGSFCIVGGSIIIRRTTRKIHNFENRISLSPIVSPIQKIYGAQLSISF